MIVRDGCALFWHLEADYIFLTRSNATCGGVWVNYSAQAIILDTINFTRFLFLARLLQSFRRAKARIGKSFLHNLLCIMLINFTSFRLAIRTKFSAMNGTFIRSDTEPVEALHDLFFRAGNEAPLIRIFETQNKLSAVFAGKQIIK